MKRPAALEQPEEMVEIGHLPRGPVMSEQENAMSW
jgi:hypothetical protein